jgi:uncharacterized protein (DUF58 family)
MKPGAGLIIAALAWFLLGAGAFFSPFLSLLWLYLGLSLLPFVIVDGLFLFFLTDRLKVSREISSSLAQGETVGVMLRIAGGGRPFIPFKVLFYDLYPPSMECSAFPAVIDHRRGLPVDFEYTLLPRERGRWLFRGLHLLLSSPLRFWRLKVFKPCESSGRTYPDFKKIRAAAGSDLRGFMEQSGIKQIRRRGEGLEFRSLRDYQEGDSLRAVDWRASSRRRQLDDTLKLIVKEYQEEQDQQVLFLLDTGYRLHRPEGECPSARMQFDSALEAVLLLSWVSLKHGDSVAVGTFGKTRRWILPRKGIGSFPVLMNGLYDLSSAPVPSSPFSGLEYALARLKRRTFIILISNFREEDGESLSWILKRIEKRHLLLLVSLREKESGFLAARNPANLEESLETAAAFSYLAARRKLYSTWEHSGLLTMEAPAQELSSALINRYLQVKRSGRL